VKGYKVRSYIPERQQKGRRHWEGKAAQQQAVYANRRRVQVNTARACSGSAAIGGTQLRSLLRHASMRRTHLRQARQHSQAAVDHVGAFNLSLIFRRLLAQHAAGRKTWEEAVFVLSGLFTRRRINIRRAEGQTGTQALRVEAYSFMLAQDHARESLLAPQAVRPLLMVI